MQKVSNKVLWIIIAILSVLFLGESVLFRHQIKETAKYYYNRTGTFIKDTMDINDFLNCDVNPKTIVVFEPNPYHLECMPGFVKYYTDLGYNVDILMRDGCEESMERFEPKDKIRIFKFRELKNIEFYADKIFNKCKKYDYSMIHTADPHRKDMIFRLKYKENPNSIFVLHNYKSLEVMGLEEFRQKNQLFGLADYGKLNYVNPNYFGNVAEHKKNEQTTFYITSSPKRDYTPLIAAANRLDSQGVDFKINVTGHTDTFCKEMIPENLKKHFEFYGKVSYQKMYSIIEQSDFIIINLDPDLKEDNYFRTERATGSAQLGYGFHKPIIISTEFADTYKLTDDTALIYDNKDMLPAMTKAIDMSSDNYDTMQENMKDLCKQIYDISLENVKKALKIQ